MKGWCNREGGHLVDCSRQWLWFDCHGKHVPSANKELCVNSGIFLVYAFQLLLFILSLDLPSTSYILFYNTLDMLPLSLRGYVAKVEFFFRGGKPRLKVSPILWRSEP